MVNVMHPFVMPNTGLYVPPKGGAKENKDNRVVSLVTKSIATAMREEMRLTNENESELVRRVLESYYKSQAVEVSTVDLEGAPMIDVAVACGPVQEAREDATMFYVSRQTADEMNLDPATDFFIRARDESMEGRGIIDEFAVLLSPLQANRYPRRNEIALIAFDMGEGEVKSTLKTWDGQKGDNPRLLDGAGDEFELPEGFISWKPVAIAKGVVGGL